MGLRKKAKKFLENSLFNKGYILEKITDINKLNNLLKKLSPVATDKNLIRIGSINDGGYIVPNVLEDIKYCYSAGIGFNYDFEFKLAKKGIKCFMADFSINEIEKNSNLIFDKIFISGNTEDKYLSIEDWIQKKEADPSVGSILKIDVEGDEYKILNSVNKDFFLKFKIIIIEFHNLHYLFNEKFFFSFHDIIEKIINNFYCVHIHPNNDVDFVKKKENITIPPVMEFTFINKKNLKINNQKLFFPNKLDSDNNPDKRSIVLPECWKKA
jgi:hypothetical protein